MHYNTKHGRTRTYHKRYSKIACFALAILVMVSCMCMPASAAEGRTDQELQTLINECVAKKETAHQMAEFARLLGFGENHFIIQTAKQIWHEQNDLQAGYNAELKAYNEKMAKKRAECPYATRMYERLRSHGLSHVTASGIMGSIMGEVGGNTLKYVNPYLRVGCYYGACMWNINYHPGANNLGADAQMDYLVESMPSSMRMFGGSFEYFKSIKDVQQAARYFCNYYERGEGVSIRARNALIAFEYYS